MHLMDLQSKLNMESVYNLPKTRTCMAEAPEFESRQIYQKALQLINNAPKPILEMTDEERDKFDDECVRVFKYKGWI